MICFTDSQTGWGFSKPRELCWPELGAGVWVTGPHPALGTGARGYLSACPWESLFPGALVGAVSTRKSHFQGDPVPRGLLPGLCHGSWGAQIGQFYI